MLKWKSFSWISHKILSHALKIRHNDLENFKNKIMLDKNAGKCYTNFTSAEEGFFVVPSGARAFPSAQGVFGVREVRRLTPRTGVCPKNKQEVPT